MHSPLQPDIGQDDFAPINSGARSVTVVSDRENAPMVGTTPQVWVLISDRVGDSKHALALADLIGLPYVTKRIVPCGGSFQNKFRSMRFDPGSLDGTRSSDLTAPWPDLMIAIGKWPIATARWIKARSDSPKPITVLIGRPPPGSLAEFDLVLAAAHHIVPKHPAIAHAVMLPVPLDATALRLPRDAAQRSFPLTAVFVGGPTKPFVLDAGDIPRLVADLESMQELEGGSVHVVSGPRTPPTIVEALRKELPRSFRFTVWQGGGSSSEIYSELLSTADQFVVSGDSVSTIADVVALRKPLAIFELRVRRGPAFLWSKLRAWFVEHRALCGIFLLLHRSGFAGFPRDIGALHRMLYARGLATRLGYEAFDEPPAWNDECLRTAVQRTIALLGQRASTDSQNVQTLDSTSTFRRPA